MTGWPAHAQNGTGAVWFDTTNDVLAKSEAHLHNPNGVTVDQVTELTSIDMNAPATSSALKLPQGFTMADSEHTCGSL